MILVTGASGKTGRTLVHHLIKAGAKVRAFVHRMDPSLDWMVSEGVEIASGDLYLRRDLLKAMDGVDAIYHIPPNMCPDEVRIGRNVIAAAVARNVSRMVYHSVLHSSVRRMPHHWQKARVEELIFTSGLSFTILQPAVYMQNLLAYWPKMLGEGVYEPPYATETRLGLVDLEDVAAAATRILLEKGFEQGIYELVGTQALSQAEVAGIAAAKLRRTIHVECIPFAAWEAQARNQGMPDYTIKTLLKMFDYYEKYGMGGNPGILAWILNRPPTTLSQFFDRILATGSLRR